MRPGVKHPFPCLAPNNNKVRDQRAFRMEITAGQNDGQDSPCHRALHGLTVGADAGAAFSLQQGALLPFGNPVGGPWMEAAVAGFPAFPMGRSDFVVPKGYASSVAKSSGNFQDS